MSFTQSPLTPASSACFYSENTGVITAQVLPHYVTHLLCLDGVDLCLFSVNFCQSILILDVYYVLFSKQNAPEISSCGGDRVKEKQNTHK